MKTETTLCPVQLHSGHVFLLVSTAPLLSPSRLKQLREEPYTQAEAERAAGMGSYIPPKTVEVKTQPVEEDMD